MTVFPFIRTVEPSKFPVFVSENVTFTLLLPLWMISRSTFPTNKEIGRKWRIMCFGID